MIWVILFSLAIIYLFVYMIFINRQIPYVIAGNLGNDCVPYHHKRFGALEFLKINGKLVDPSKYFMGVVNGDSMSARNLHRSDFFVAEYFDKEKIELHPQEILVIRISKKDHVNYNKLKLREYVESLDSDTIQTKTYLDENRWRLSTPHKISDVIAVVKKKITNI